MHGPLREPWPPPSAEIVPDTLMSPPLINLHEPSHTIVAPAPTEKKEPADHTPLVVVAVDDAIEREVRPVMETLETGLITLPAMDKISAVSANDDGSVTDAHDDIDSFGHHALLLALPSVRALPVTTNVGVLNIVRSDMPASMPDQDHDGKVTVDVGGSHSVEPDVSVRELMRGMITEMTGDADCEHRNGRGDCIVNASLVDSGVYEPLERTESTFVTPGAIELAASQLTYPHITRCPESVVTA